MEQQNAFFLLKSIKRNNSHLDSIHLKHRLPISVPFRLSTLYSTQDSLPSE